MNEHIEQIPAISVFNGSPVEPGADGYRKVEKDLFDIVEHLRSQYKRIYMIDLNGIHQNSPQTDLIQELSSDTEVWVDAGPRIMEDLMDIITSGATKAVMGTKTLLSMKEFQKSLEITENVIFSVDLINDSIASLSKEIGLMSIPEVLEWVEKAPILQIYWMNRGTAGNSLNTAPFFEILRDIRHPALYAANLRREDLEHLPEGVAGAVFRYTVSSLEEW